MASATTAGVAGAGSPSVPDIRVYAGAAHALLEFTLGFREQFPLKKKYYYFKDLDPHFALAATALAKAGLQVTALDMSVILDVGGVPDGAMRADAAKITALLETFDREFGFIFLPIDNSVTGRVYPFAELQQALAAKSFPRLLASYGQHRLTGMRVGLERNEAVMYNFGASALLALGDRMRFGSPVASALSLVTANDLRDAKKSLEADIVRGGAEGAVQEFEIKCAKDNSFGAKNIFAAGDGARLFDRSVVCFEDMDGYAFLTALAERLGEPLREPGKDWRFETTSLSRWGGIRTMDWLKTPGVAGSSMSDSVALGLKPEQIRGLITIDARLLSTPDFEKHFVAARAAVLKQQLG